MSYKCGHCDGTHDTADEGRACSSNLFLFDSPEPRKDEPTERQVNYAQSLLHERVPYGHAFHLEQTEGISAAEEYVNSLSKKEIGEFISGMVKHAHLREERVKSGPPIQVGEGIYLRDGIYYKVQRAVHGSGHMYAKQWDPDTKKFEFTVGAVSKLRPEHKLDLEEAKRFGHIYGICCVCGRTLTDEDSIAAGIGPHCGKMFGDVDRIDR